MKNLIFAALLLTIPLFAGAQSYYYYNDEEEKEPEAVLTHFSNGNLKSEIYYNADGKMDGTAKFYFEDDGTLYAVVEFKDGIQEGSTVVYSALNPFMLELEYEKGQAVSGNLVQKVISKKRLSKTQILDWNSNKSILGFSNRFNTYF